MKISAQILTMNERDYIGYCLESIKNIVDEIVIIDGASLDGTTDIIYEFKKNNPKIKIIEEVCTKYDDYAYLRNLALSKTKADWILFLDADEVLAYRNGDPISRKEFENIIQNCKCDTIDFFTYHFMENYYTLDGRDNGRHFSQNRLFNRKKADKFVNPMHEVLTFKKPHKRGILTNPIIWHFGGCKSPEATRRKYTQCMRIFPDQFKGFKNANEYCRQHEVFRGTRPTIRYFGPLPKIMELW